MATSTAPLLTVMDIAEVIAKAHIPQSDAALLKKGDKATLSITTPQGERTLTASYIIGADGTHSTVRRLLQISADTLDYQQSALVTMTQLKRPHHHIAYERFQKQGAIAMLPLSDEKTATIWTDSTENIAALMKLSEQEFIDQLQKQFGYRLGKLLQTGQRHHYPLHHLTAARTCQQRILLIGNAAHTLHPIAAQGFNLALAEIAMASGVGAAAGMDASNR